jgi:hypothetical protein
MPLNSPTSPPSSKPGITRSGPTILAVMAVQDGGGSVGPPGVPVTLGQLDRRPQEHALAVGGGGRLDRGDGAVGVDTDPSRTRPVCGSTRVAAVQSMIFVANSTSPARGQDRRGAVGRGVLKLSPRRHQIPRPRPMSTPPAVGRRSRSGRMWWSGGPAGRRAAPPSRTRVVVVVVGPGPEVRVGGAALGVDQTVEQVRLPPVVPRPRQQGSGASEPSRSACRVAPRLAGGRTGVGSPARRPTRPVDRPRRAHTVSLARHRRPRTGGRSASRGRLTRSGRSTTLLPRATACSSVRRAPASRSRSSVSLRAVRQVLTANSPSASRTGSPQRFGATPMTSAGYLQLGARIEPNPR